MNAANHIEPGELAGFAILDALDRSGTSKAARLACLTRVRRGESLFQQGDPARRIWLCRKGQLKLFRLSPTGQEKIMALITPGRSFAEATMFMSEPRYPVHCSALVSSEVIGLETELLIEYLRGDTAACFRLMATLSRRMQEKINQIDALSLQNAHLRISAYLLDEYHRRDRPATFSLVAGKKHIAGLLAVQPETLSRSLGQLQKDGIVECQARRITVLQPGRLESMVRNGS